MKPIQDKNMIQKSSAGVVWGYFLTAILRSHTRSFIHSLKRHDRQKISMIDVLTIDFKLSNVHQGNPLLISDSFRR